MTAATLAPNQRRSRGVGRDDPHPTTLYRAYDEAGDLLYVGIARSWVRRWEHHKTGSPWFGEVRRIVLEDHPDRASALDAERQAIQLERPRYNVEHDVEALIAIADAYVATGADLDRTITPQERSRLNYLLGRERRRGAPDEG